MSLNCPLKCLVMWSALLATALADDESSATPPRAPQSTRELRQSVHQALKQEATSRGATHDAVVRQLVALFDELQTNEQLGLETRRQLQSSVRDRLAKVSDALQFQAGQGGTALDSILPPRNRENLAQRQAPAGGGGMGPARQAAPSRGGAALSPSQQSAQELINLIQRTIAPSAWDINGGAGTIIYFEQAQVLVIRAPQAVHDQLGPAFRNLRN